MDGKPERENQEQHRVFDVNEADERGTPSQAEGDRETIERNLAAKGLGGQDDRPDGEQYEGGGQGDPVFTPSQAEGERDEIDEIDEDMRARGEA